MRCSAGRCHHHGVTAARLNEAAAGDQAAIYTAGEGCRIASGCSCLIPQHPLIYKLGSARHGSRMRKQNLLSVCRRKDRAAVPFADTLLRPKKSSVLRKNSASKRQSITDSSFLWREFTALDRCQLVSHVITCRRSLLSHVSQLLRLCACASFDETLSRALLASICLFLTLSMSAASRPQAVLYGAHSLTQSTLYSLRRYINSTSQRWHLKKQNTLCLF